MDTWEAYAYDSKWYQFINIREEVSEVSKVKASEVYTLMNSRTMSYLVYDATNQKVTEVKSAANIDESNLNHNWMSFEKEGKKYVYNIGAKKYLQSTAGGFVLGDNPVAISLSNGEEGVRMGQDYNEWSFVKNQYLQASEGITPVISVKAQDTSSLRYTLDGRRVTGNEKGLVIIGGRKVLKK